MVHSSVASDASANIEASSSCACKMDNEMTGDGDDNGSVVDDGASVVTEGRKRGLSGSMSLRTRKLGRRLSRSMSIVALKLPEKAHSITRSSTKLMRTSSKDKKNRSFELSIILPDKTQRQVSKTYHLTNVCSYKLS